MKMVWNLVCSFPKNGEVVEIGFLHELCDVACELVLLRCA